MLYFSSQFHFFSFFFLFNLEGGIFLNLVKNSTHINFLFFLSFSSSFSPHPHTNVISIVQDQVCHGQVVSPNLPLIKWKGKKQRRRKNMTPKAFAILCKGCWFEREQNWLKGPKEYQIDPILVDEIYYNPMKNKLNYH